MKTAAVSELKASLSEYLLQVKAGEEVTITDRGKPIAKIIPLKRGTMELPAHLFDLARAGLVKIGTGKLPKNFWALSRPTDSQGEALISLLSEREKGR